jgi:hypothetical protein
MSYRSKMGQNSLSIIVLVGFAAALLLGQAFVPSALAQTNQSSPAEITSPDPKLALTSTLVTFAWSSGTGVSQYWLSIGKNSGGHDIYNENQGNKLSATVPGLPNDGSKIYVRLWSKTDKSWVSNDYTYTTCKGCSGDYTLAKITSPAPGSKLTSRSVIFKWDAGKLVSRYWLSVGRNLGGFEIYNHDQGTNLEAEVIGLPHDGSKIYVRLWSLVLDTWLSTDSTFISCSACEPNGVPAEIISPDPKQQLQSSVVTFKWDAGTNVSLYRLYVGTSEGAQDIYGRIEGRRLSAEVSGIPNNGKSVYVRLWSMIEDTWLYKDYVYKACDKCIDPATMISPTPGTVLSGSKVMFSWDSGTGVTKYKLTIGKSLGSEEYYSEEGTPRSRMVHGLPTDGSVIYVRLSSLMPAATTVQSSDLQLTDNLVWKSIDYLYIANPGHADIAEMVNPEPGSAIKGSTATFSWDKCDDAVEYWLSIGSTLGGRDYADGSAGTALSKKIETLPANDKPIYVRLWSLVSTTWRFNDYVYLSAK